MPRATPSKVAGDEEVAPFEAHSRRFTIMAGLAIALGIGVSAWNSGGRKDLNQTVQGGFNASLLPKISDPAPDFLAQGASDSRPVRLSDYRGRPVWLNFWGSWCPPCRSEMPELQEAYEELHPQGFELLAVSLKEPAGQALDFATRVHATFTLLSDPDQSDTGAAYPIANFPTHILIDEQGVIRDIVIAALERDEIVKRAEQILVERK